VRLPDAGADRSESVTGNRLRPHAALRRTGGKAGQYPRRGYWPIKRPQRGAANPRRVFLQQLGGYLSAGGLKQTRCQICLFPKPENRHKFRSGGVRAGRSDLRMRGALMAPAFLVDVGTNESAYSLNRTKACRPVSVRTIGAFGWRGSSAMNPPRHRFQYAVLPAGPMIVQNSPVRVRVTSPRETASSPLSWDLVNSGTACLAIGASSLRLPQPLHAEFVVVALQVPPTFH
jgi:hypothetical protein